jgi:peptide/nickel transport system permease protein
VGVSLGILAARHRGTIIDGIARFFALLGASLPAFWAGLVLLYVFYAQLGWLPGREGSTPVTHLRRASRLLHGRLAPARRHQHLRDAVRHLILPATVLGSVWSASSLASVRASLLDEFSLEYVRVAQAPWACANVRSSTPRLRNALLPTITIVAFTFAF